MDKAVPGGTKKVIHKEKEAKRNTVVQQPVASRPIGNSTIGRVSHVSSPPQIGVGAEQSESVTIHKQLALDQSQLARAERRSRSIQTLEIDDYLFGLVMEGILDEDWLPYAAKACYTLGLQRVNKIVIQVRSANYSKDGHSPDRLFMWKINGAMQLHFKKQFYADQSPGFRADEDAGTDTR